MSTPTVILGLISFMLMMSAGLYLIVTSIERMRGRGCPECDYDLRGHAAAARTCPECGAALSENSGAVEEWNMPRFWLGAMTMLIGGLGAVWLFSYAVLRGV